MTPARGTTARIDPQALMRIRNLQLRARRVVEGFYQGLHRSPYHGFSVEFSQYRPYSAGDDPRTLDWKLYARSDRYHIKQFEDETSRRCYLVIDQSRSMQYSTLAYDKAEYARTLAATLAYFLISQRDSVGLLAFGAEATEFLPAKHRPGHFRRLLALLERDFSSPGTNLEKPLEKIVATIQRRGLVILISDLLVPVDSLKRQLTHLVGRGHEVFILRVLDPGECTLELDQPSVLVDLESGAEMFVDPANARDSYRRGFLAHAQQILESCKPLGVHCMTMTTDQPLESALFELLRQSALRGSGRGRR